jgi:hypothetical protein
MFGRTGTVHFLRTSGLRGDLPPACRFPRRAAPARLLSTNEAIVRSSMAVPPMYSHQSGLPRMPVPPLEESLRRYYRSVEPLLGAADAQETRNIIAGFEDGDGPQLQAILAAAADADGTVGRWVGQYYHAA